MIPPHDLDINVLDRRTGWKQSDPKRVLFFPFDIRNPKKHLKFFFWKFIRIQTYLKLSSCLFLGIRGEWAYGRYNIIRWHLPRYGNPRGFSTSLLYTKVTLLLYYLEFLVNETVYLNFRSFRLPCYMRDKVSILLFYKENIENKKHFLHSLYLFMWLFRY